MRPFRLLSGLALSLLIAAAARAADPYDLNTASGFQPAWTAAPGAPLSGWAPAPPSEAGWELLGAFLDRALEGVVPPGQTTDGFTESSDIRPR